MIIKKQPIKTYNYAFIYSFNYEILNFCRSLKTKFNNKQFGFKDKAWRFNDLNIVELIKQRYPSVALDISMQADMEKFELDKKKLKLQIERAKELKKAVSTDFVVNNIKGKMYPYQKIGVQFFLNNNGKAILSDQMGTGKTLQSLAYVAHNKISKTLVICPASVKGSWRNETIKWTKLKPYVIDSKTDLTLDVINEYDVFIINYDILHKFMGILTTARFDCEILDEFHYIKTTSSKRSKCVKLISKNIPSILLLSGTPMLNRPKELFNGLSLIDPTNWSDYYHYSRRYCDGHQGSWGWEDNGATNIEELQEKISHYFLRRTKDNVLKELPPKTFIDVPIKIENDKRKEYDLAENSFMQYLKEIKEKTDDEARRSFSAEKITKLNELRMITSNGKIKTAKEIIENIIDSGEKVVVFSVYNAPIEQLKEYFGNNAVMITGKVDIDERNKAIERFQNDDSCKVFLGGMKAAGVGLTLTAAANVLFIDYSWVPADHLQAEDRIHRPGQKADHATIYQIIAENTIDEKMKEILSKKQELFNRLIENKKIKKSDNDSIINDLLKSYNK